MNKFPSYTNAKFSVRLTLLCLLVLASAERASAAGFAERFRSFVLGVEAQAGSRPPGLDPSARGCLQCHDGSRAAHVTVRAGGSPMPIRGAQTLNHPVGMMYDRSVAKDPHGYKARAMLHPNIRLVEGQVTCVSCHQTRSNLAVAASATAHPDTRGTETCTATQQLTMGRHDRDLCLACHIK